MTPTKNLLVLVVFILLPIVSIMGCGKDNSPSGTEDTYPFTITFNASSSEINLVDFPRYTIEGEETVKLSDLIDTAVVAEPYNFAFRLIGSDGFYAHSKGSPDNTWNHLQSGYIVLSSMSVTFDTSLGIIKRYNINDVVELKILRKINFITPADSLIQYIVDELPHVTFQDSLNAVALTELIPQGVVSNPSSLIYDLTASDDYTATLTYQELQMGVLRYR